ncbi:3-oxoacyl-[acyl-carrier-protein] synthase 3 protein 2 [Legionella antarctica]|uniref:3-oxoacyl-[acyl-carrier-protein] synthase 3 protein 2 n=1 Tax=Legionella antarctica TaxID=2708020 RepID=A0A6F8T1R6_9GAMM|nr:beta-ketoacyl-ACP synthase 3 [Legionella antarctica]BCA94624.1 3-oxoacyl-[acyl-carrier-protein] synthase 3 protein 2 [Legionella antarctica]
MKTIIIDSSVYVPKQVVSNDVYEKKFNLEKNWIEKRTGIQLRHLAEETQSTSDLAVEAIKPILSRNSEPIEFILCATSTPDSLLPSTANKICNKLDLNHDVFCFDIMAACSGFLYALSVANAFIQSGLYQSGIVVGSDKMSAIINQEDPYTCTLFGDAAGAFLLKKSSHSDKGIISTVLGSDSTGVDKLFIKAGGSEIPMTSQRLLNNEHYVTMLGKEVFINAVNKMTSMIDKVTEKSGLSSKEIHYIIPHQANQRISDAVYDKLGRPEHVKMFSIIKNHGNIVNASIPVTYHCYQKEMSSNKNMIMVSFGAGFNFGALHIRT